MQAGMTIENAGVDVSAGQAERAGTLPGTSLFMANAWRVSQPA